MNIFMTLSLTLLASLPHSLAAHDIQETRVKKAAQECKKDAQTIAQATQDVGWATAALIEDTAELATETARLAGKKAEDNAKMVVKKNTSTAQNIATTVHGFTTIASTSSASQLEQVGNATVQYIDKLICPLLFTAAGYLAYIKAIKPYLPPLSPAVKKIEARHYPLEVTREIGAGVLTGGILFAGLHGLLSCPKVADYFDKNMPNTAALLSCIVNRECKLINNTFSQPSAVV